MSYAYDGNGKRVKSYNAVTDQTTIFVYDADGSLAAEYTINVPPPTTPTISYLTEDALGSPRAISNSFGEIKSGRDFLPFGEELYASIGDRNTNQKYSSNNDDTRQKFTGYQRDTETGLDFAQSRYYSPMQGRFTSPDEFKGGPDELFDFEEDASDNPTFYADLTNPQSLNKYQYTYNNPYKFTDSDGHVPCCEKSTPAVIAPIIAGAAAVVAYILFNPSEIGPRQKQTTAEAIGDIAGVLPIPGSKVVGGLVGKVAGKLFGEGTKAAVKQTVKQTAKQATKQTFKGSKNPAVAKAISKGKQAHKEFSVKVKKKGWKSEPGLKNPQTGKTVRPDAVTKSGKPVELKPNTPSGRKQGAKQLKGQESATGKKGRVVYYDPDK